MRRRWTGWAILIFLVLAIGLGYPLLVKAGFELPRPSAEPVVFPTHSGLASIEVDARLDRTGTIEVSQRVRFRDEKGGTLVLPQACADVPLTFTGCAANVSVDGRAVLLPPQPQRGEVAIGARTARVRYDLRETTRRYLDIAYLQALVVVTEPEATQFDAHVELRGTLRLPRRVQASEVEAFIFAPDRDRTARLRGPSTIVFSADTHANTDTELHIALPPRLVPDVPAGLAIPAPGRTQFDIVTDVRTTTSDSTAGIYSTVRGGRTIVKVLFNVIGWGIAGIAWLAVLFVGIFRRLRKPVVEGVPAFIETPPGPEDPAVVSALVGDGYAKPEGVAGSVLVLADKKVLDIQQLSGGKFVIRITNRTRGTYAGEVLLINELWAAAGNDGELEGPPVWPDPKRWWGSYQKDALERAKWAGLVRRAVSPAIIGTASIWTGVGLGINFFLTNPTMFTITMGLFAMAGQAVAVTTGFTLTARGMLQRERWKAYGRYLGQIEHLEDVGPGGVVIWGTKLAYGTVLGVAKTSAEALTPDV